MYFERSRYLLFSAFGTDSLITGYDYGFINVLGETSARQVVYRRGKALQDRTYGLHSGKTLHKLVGYIAGFERGEYKYIGLTAKRAVRSLALCHSGHNSGIGLKLAVDNT